MADSSIKVNMSFSNDDEQTRTPAGEKRKNRFHHKQERRRGFRGGRSKRNHETGQHRLTAALPIGAAAPCQSLPPVMPSMPDPGSKATVSVQSRNRAPPRSQKPITPQTSPGIPSQYLAIDCEMVGTGPKGSVAHLARCSLVSYEGDVVYDKFIKPSVPVTDYRTRWSGIRHRDLVDATPYCEARKEILKLLMGRVVIGHAIHNDFKALGYTHPTVLTRDTSRIPLLNAKAGFAEKEVASLKRLTKAVFDQDIQTGRKGHSSVEDARATMRLYRVVEVEWERELASKAQDC